MRFGKRSSRKGGSGKGSPSTTDVAFEVELRRSGVTETVGADQRVLEGGLID